MESLKHVSVGQAAYSSLNPSKADAAKSFSLNIMIWKVYYRLLAVMFRYILRCLNARNLCHTTIGDF